MFFQLNHCKSLILGSVLKPICHSLKKQKLTSSLLHHKHVVNLLRLSTIMILEIFDNLANQYDV